MNHSTLFNNTTAVGNTSQLCIPVYDYIAHAPQSRKTLMNTIFIFLSMVSAFVNSVVIYAIIKTKQYQNQSTLLILVASVADIGTVVITNPWYVVYIKMGERINCKIKYIVYSMSVIPIYGVTYTFSLISLDRYLRLHFLQRYATAFNNRRYQFACSIVLMVTISQSLMSGLGSGLSGHFQGAKLTFPINTIALSLTVIWYLMSIFKLKHHQRQHNSQSIESKGLTKMASIYLLIFFACYAPVVLYQILLKILWKHIDPVDVSTVSYLVIYVLDISGIANRVTFLTKNRPTKYLLKTVSSRLGKSRAHPKPTFIAKVQARSNPSFRAENQTTNVRPNPSFGNGMVQVHEYPTFTATKQLAKIQTNSSLGTVNQPVQAHLNPSFLAVKQPVQVQPNPSVIAENQSDQTHQNSSFLATKQPMKVHPHSSFDTQVHPNPSFGSKQSLQVHPRQTSEE